MLIPVKKYLICRSKIRNGTGRSIEAGLQSAATTRRLFFFGITVFSIRNIGLENVQALS
jgi:hypothetical protein